jgi:flagellar motor protein MotB
MCFHAAAQTQNAPAQDESKRRPLYKITIVSRTTKAINYGYLSAPTSINFAGTPLLPDAKGDAAIEPRRGATSITAHFSNVPPPTRFGPQYLTYVVWAISPDGRPQNLGELMLDASNKGTLRTSAPMQTFALIVTAEPYYAVTQPSDVVVMENQVGPNTIGKVEEVNATYELLPRKPYTYDPEAHATAASGRTPVSKREYDSIVALYQALNAIQIAEAQHAGRYAPERLARARELYNQARAYPPSQSKEVVSMAREATQIAEDSRAIALRRAAEERDAQRQLQQQPPAAPPAREPAPPPRTSQVEPERTTAPPEQSYEANRSRVVPPSTAVQAPEQPDAEMTSDQPSIAVNPDQFRGHSPEKTQNRARLVSALRRYFETRDTPRGVIVTIREPLAASPTLPSYLQQLAATIQPYDNIHLNVEANSAEANDVAATQRQAETMRQALIAAGVPPAIIIARGNGNARPLASNATAAGRSENQRIEIVIAGDAIGRLPTWDRTYNIGPAGGR